MATTGYRLLDEPRPGRAAQLAVEPMWILLGTMLGGVWFGWPWFVLNAIAVGSPTRVREIVAVCIGFAGTIAITLGVFWAFDGPLSHLGVTAVRYAHLGLLIWKIALSYYLTVVQGRTMALYRYYGGIVRNGAWIALGSMFLRRWVLGPMPDFWGWVLS